jgi:hypothetical protein
MSEFFCRDEICDAEEFARSGWIVATRSSPANINCLSSGSRLA